MFEWIQSNLSSLIITLAPTNITLNCSTQQYFLDVRYVMVGIDKENYQLAIKPIKKIDIEKKVVPTTHLHKISNGKGYSRITNKLLCEQISQVIQKPLDNLKASGYFDEEQGMLIVDLKKLM